MKKATARSCHRLLHFGFVIVKKVMATNCRHLLVFGFVATKKAMTTSCRCLLPFGFVATKKATTTTTIAFFFHSIAVEKVVASRLFFFLQQRKRW